MNPPILFPLGMDALLIERRDAFLLADTMNPRHPHETFMRQARWYYRLERLVTIRLKEAEA